MKKCKKCGNEFKSYVYIDGKHCSLTGRSYCLDCSPFGKKSGYYLRKKNNCKPDGKPYGKICPVCEKKQKKYWKNDVCSTCRNAFFRYKQARKLKFLHGNKCVFCGCNDIDILQFHHLKDKKFSLSGFYHSKNFEDLKNEASKCILLCPNCHAKEHIKDKQHIIDYYLSGVGGTRTLNF